jgi:hypothetical protein
MKKKFFLLLLLLWNSISFAYPIHDVIEHDKICKKEHNVVNPGTRPTLDQLKQIAVAIRDLLITGPRDPKTYAVGHYPNQTPQGNYVVASSANGLAVTNFNDNIQPIEEIYRQIKKIIADVVCPDMDPQTSVNLVLIHNISNRTIQPNFRMDNAANLGRATGNGIAFLPLRSRNVHAEMAIHQYFGLATSAQFNLTLNSNQLIPNGLQISASRPACTNCAGAMNLSGALHGCLLNRTTPNWQSPSAGSAAIANGIVTEMFTAVFLEFLQQIVNPTTRGGRAGIKSK